MTETRLQNLPDEGGHWLYSFGELVFRTDTLSTSRPDRVIPLGGAAGIIMSFLTRYPEKVQGRRVLEPFCGSGPLGILACALGAAQVTCLDLNPRAIEYLEYNLQKNSLVGSQLDAVVGDVAEFEPAERFDLVVANPPFVPTPPCVGGVLHSASGVDGTLHAGVLATRLSDWLTPHGEAMISVFQIEKGGEPLLAQVFRDTLPDRSIEFTKGSRFRGVPFRDFARGYEEKLPSLQAVITQWIADLEDELGPDLTVDNYVVHVGPVDGNACVVIRDYDGSKYGEDLFRPRHSARSVALENIIGGS